MEDLAAAGLLGREQELAVVEQCLAATGRGDSGVLLLSGDAGMGKTSLVQVTVAKATEQGFTVLVGHCLDIEAGIPFGPILEAVKPLLIHEGDRDRPVVGHVLERAQLEGGSGEPNPTLVLDALRGLIEETVASNPVVLVLEDMHWVDRSTQDLALALARTVSGPLLSVLTYRKEELTRRHPFRQALVGLGLGARARRLDLSPLGRSAVHEMVQRHDEGGATRDRVDAVLVRSEGNPLYVEELLASEDVAHDTSVSSFDATVPPLLSDLFLARVDSLSEPARHLLRAASAGGAQVDPDIVSVVAGMEARAGTRLWREVLEANLIVGAEPLRFRHGLLREAVYADLLPAERRALHSRFAEALEGRVDCSPEAMQMSTLGQIAFHYVAAQEHSAALVASVRAGLAAARFGAPETATHFQRAVDSWDRVPNAAAVSGLAKADLLLLLGEAVGRQGDLLRWKELVEAAARLLDPEGDPLLAGRVSSAMGVLVGFGIMDSSGHEEQVHRAVASAGEEPHAELARLLVARAAVHARHFRHALALADASRALEVSRAVRAADAEVAALVDKGVASIMLGRYGAGLADLTEAVRVADRSGQRGESLVQQGHLAWHHLMAGHIETGLDLARRGRRAALAEALPVVAAYCGEQEVECLTWQGRLDESDALLAELVGLGMPEYRRMIFRAQSLVERGDGVGALQVERDMALDPARAAGIVSTDDGIRQVRLFLMLGDTAQALAVADSLLSATEGSDSPLSRAIAARAGYEALRAARPAGIDEPTGMADRAARALATATAGLNEQWRGSLYDLDRVIAAGHARSLAGEGTLDDRRTAVEIATTFGDGVLLAPQLWLAEELLRAGQRDEGRVLLVQLWQSARALGARHVQEEATRLARRNRIPLPGATEAAGPLAKLTPREREVLDVLTTGATTRTIATRLFISEKTVGVHITNVLAKLGVANRGEAAALARSLIGQEATQR